MVRWGRVIKDNVGLNKFKTLYGKDKNRSVFGFRGQKYQREVTIGQSLLYHGEEPV